eukprot:4532855-Heterocapsa_arctica.AAC.1
MPSTPSSPTRTCSSTPASSQSNIYCRYADHGYRSLSPTHRRIAVTIRCVQHLVAIRAFTSG